MKVKELFKKIKEDIDTHVDTIGYFTNDKGTIPIKNMSALLLRFKAICEGKSLKEAIKIQQEYMKRK